MDFFDLIIVLAAIGYAIGGYRSGAVVGVFSMIGFIGGAVIGAQIAEPLGSRVADGRAQVPVAIFCVLLLAVMGQLLGVYVAGHVKARIVRERGRPVDSAIGSVIGVLAVLVVSWMVAVPLASSPYPNLAGEASRSKIVRAVDGVMPDNARHLYSSMRSFLDQSGFPPVFGDLPSTSITPVPPAPSNLSVAFRNRITAARGSILKILAQAPECNRGIEGSGFVFAKDRMLTNAHVVAGAQSVQVQLPDGGSARATVVDYDPDNDIAVLYVPGLDATPLTFKATDAGRNDVAAVIGYPENGPFTVRSARVRGKTEVNGTNIYGEGNVRRSIYSIRAIVREGNSGGPLLAENGQVLGMVFATARDSNDTGFVLTKDQLADAVNSNQDATARIGTGDCTPD